MKIQKCFQKKKHKYFLFEFISSIQNLCKHIFDNFCRTIKSYSNLFWIILKFPDFFVILINENWLPVLNTFKVDKKPSRKTQKVELFLLWKKINVKNVILLGLLGWVVK